MPLERGRRRERAVEGLDAIEADVGV